MSVLPGATSGEACSLISAMRSEETMWASRKEGAALLLRQTACQFSQATQIAPTVPVIGSTMPVM
jgi:hypothetical protein